MKKRLFIFVLVALIAAGTVSAWEPSDLTKFPVGQENGDCIINFGIGLGSWGHYVFGNDYVFILPLRLSADWNVALGGLPFFFGGLFTYSGYGSIASNSKWYYSSIALGGRAGYHFNWNVPNLDTYAVTTMGMYFDAGSRSWTDSYFDGSFFIDFKLGARYFVADWFGFWAELGYGYTSLTFLEIGLSFKF